MLIGQASASTAGSREAVWGLWSDPARWPDWDPDVQSVTFAEEQGFVAGAEGSLQPPSGPRVSWTLDSIEPQREFVTVARLPGAKIAFTHRLTGTDDDLVVSHEVEMTGPMAWFFGRVLGPRLAPGLTDAVRNVAQMAAGDRA